MAGFRKQFDCLRIHNNSEFSDKLHTYKLTDVDLLWSQIIVSQSVSQSRSSLQLFCYLCVSTVLPYRSRIVSETPSPDYTADSEMKY
jgi:hypothetical protein